MPVVGMNHFTVLTDSLERTLGFYVGLLGLSEGPRPPLGFPGAWLYADGHAVLHVIAGRPLPLEHRGVLDHMAFTATGLGEVVARLRAARIDFDLKRQSETNAWQLFLFDPNGARVELDFEASEPDPNA